MIHRLLLVLCLSSLPASEAFAQATEPPATLGHDAAQQSTTGTAGEVVDPRAEYHKGNAAFRDGRLTVARFHYRRSVEADLSFDAMCNLGRTEASLEDDVAAYEHLTKCLELHPSDPVLVDSRDRFAELLAQVEGRMTTEQKALAEKRLVLFPLVPVATPVAPPAEVAEPQPAAGRSLITLTVGAVALLGIGAGAGLLIYADDQGSAAASLREEIEAEGGSCLEQNPDPRCADLSFLVKTSDDFQNASVVTFAVSGGLLVGALVTYLVWPKAKPQARGGRPGPVGSIPDQPAEALGRGALASRRPAGFTPTFSISPQGAFGGLTGRF